ncbi:MAG: helix-turn-helix domain-containing protein [Lachnospiraceae bacterium]|nr:helix-turn-helix domain-containing protein [Lachnospiraceae bacterium]
MAKGKASEWLDDDKLLLLQGWARDGLSDEQIAENMGISVRTLYRWKNEYCQLCHALKKGKDVADREIENALFKRAKGYDFTETRIKKKAGVVVEETVITRHVPGDTTAQIFWLKNRKPEYWGGGDKFTSETETEVCIYVPDNGRDRGKAEE